MFPSQDAISRENGGGGNRTRVVGTTDSAAEQANWLRWAVWALWVVYLAALFAFPHAARAGTDHRYDHTPWVQLWQHRDRSVWTSIVPASTAFRVSQGTMRTIVEREGGNVAAWKLERSLCSGGGIGWNNSGSAAFGPYQYMLAYRGACTNPRAWGTFGAWDDVAFRAARAHGLNVPYRFKTPASNVGQSIVTAFLLRDGQLCVHWSASVC